MKRRVLAFFLAFGLVLSAGEFNVANAAFEDVAATAYYYDAVCWAVENGITNGTSATSFSPDDTCTQAQILTMLWRANHSPEPSGGYVYLGNDVTPDKYYYKAMVWAYEKELISHLAQPDEGCSRSDVVLYLWRLEGCPDFGLCAFNDVPFDSEYSEAVAWAIACGITKGTSNSTFSPESFCTRGQIVTFLYRAMVEYPATAVDGAYPGYPSVYDFRTFSGLAPMMVGFSDGGVIYGYSMPEIMSITNDPGGFIESYLDELEEAGFEAYFALPDEDGVYICYRGREAGVVMTVTQQLFIVGPVPLQYLLNFSSGDGKYYITHSIVPDFGVMVNSPMLRLAFEDHITTYFYEPELFTEENLAAYHELITAEGFLLVESADNIRAYQKDDVKVVLIRSQDDFAIIIHGYL